MVTVKEHQRKCTQTCHILPSNYKPLTYELDSTCLYDYAIRVVSWVSPEFSISFGHLTVGLTIYFKDRFSDLLLEAHWPDQS